MKYSTDSYNTPETVLVITSFPGKTDAKHGSSGFNAIGWHAQKTLSHLSTDHPILICAEENGEKTQQKLSGEIILKRIWKKGSLFSFIKLFFFILRQEKIKSVFVEFEFNIFGGIIPNILMLMLLALLRLFGKRMTFELHQVITDLKPLEKHVHITNPFLQTILSSGVKFFYRILGVSATNIIVFEEALKIRLSAFINAKKITVLSLATEKKPTSNGLSSRDELSIKDNEFVLMVFGFINGYKGIDWIIDALKDINKQSSRPIRLLIAGGENPYLKNQQSYQDFYHSIVSEARKYPHVTLTGFIPDNKVSKYFAAADMVVLPYEVFMSASGPFSLALSYGKPIILSDVLRPYTESKDFQAAMNENAITSGDMFFPLNKKSFPSRIHALRNNEDLQKKFTAFSHTLAKKRSSDFMTDKLTTLLFPVPEKRVSYHFMRIFTK